MIGGTEDFSVGSSAVDNSNIEVARWWKSCRHLLVLAQPIRLLSLHFNARNASATASGMSTSVFQALEHSLEIVIIRVVIVSVLNLPNDSFAPPVDRRRPSMILQSALAEELRLVWRSS